MRKQRYFDLIGHKYNKLLVLKYHHKDNHNHIFWLCRCDCGKEKIIRSDHLKNNAIKSCGCLNKELSKKRAIYLGKNSKKHGLSYNRIYKIWYGMKTRCYNENSPNFNRYGGRGIKICDEWKNNFMTFYNWAINNGYEETLTIDRINNDKNYSPDNCKWSTNIEQSNNKSTNNLITYKNETKTITQWSRELNINRNVLYDRLNRLNWNIDKALNTPVRKKRR